VVSDNFSLALTEDNKVFSWGFGQNGRLGHSDSLTCIDPKEVRIDLREEDKRIRQMKRRLKELDGVEDMLQFHRFIKNSTKKNDPMMN